MNTGSRRINCAFSSLQGVAQRYLEKKNSLFELLCVVCSLSVLVHTEVLRLCEHCALRALSYCANYFRLTSCVAWRTLKARGRKLGSRRSEEPNGQDRSRPSASGLDGLRAPIWNLSLKVANASLTYLKPETQFVVATYYKQTPQHTQIVDISNALCKSAK